MKIIKRDGRVVPFDKSQIRKETEPATMGLKNITAEELELRADILIKDSMSTEDLQNTYIKTAVDMIDVDCPDATYAAARLTLYDLYHKVKRTYFNKKIGGDIYKAIKFSDYHEFCSSLDLLSYSLDKFNVKKLNDAIVGSRDKEFTYLAVDTLKSRYLIKYGRDKDIVELPQHFFMSIACFLAQNEKKPTKWAIRFYNMFSELKALMATPTLSNGRVKSGNCFSCAVGSTPDNIEGIFDTYKTQALGSKFGTGWGWDWSRVRALGSTINGVPDAAGGIIPFLKIENDIAIAVDQLGVRLGAIAVSVESWHLDILDFIKMKQSGGDERRTTEELFIALSCSDEFMRRVKNNSEWTLFDAYDARNLTELYGRDFEKEYHRLESLLETNPESFINPPVKINAKDLWKKFQNIAYGVGSAFVFFKDNANNDLRPDYDDVGVIRCGNLCHEYLSPIKDTEIPLCNLASVNLARVSKKELPKYVKYTTRALDNVIDVTTYRIPNSEETQKKRRSIGLGLAGEAEAIVQEGILYGTQEHIDWIDEVYDIFAKASDEASYELGKKRGFCEYDKRFRNYHRRCLAPTSTLSILFGTTSTVEAVYDRVWKEENNDNVFNVTAPNINTDNYNLYVPVYDVDQLAAVRTTAHRQKHIDMGISFTGYFRPEVTKGKDVFNFYMLAWELGLKTVYYIRTKSMRVNTDDVKEKDIACSGCQ